MLRLQNRQGIQALDTNQIIGLLEGSSVVSGLEVSVDSGLTLSAASGQALVAGQAHTVSQATITLDAADSEFPRRDVIYINSSGQVAKITGAPERLRPIGVDRFFAAQPAPASMFGVSGAVIAEVFVDAEQAELTADDIRDRRLISAITAGRVGQTEEYDNGNSGASATIDWNNGRSQKLTLTADCTISFTNPAFVGRYDLRIIQGAGGEHDILSVPGIFPDGQPEWKQGAEGDEIILTVRFDGAKYVAFDSGYYEVE